MQPECGGVGAVGGEWDETGAAAAAPADDLLSSLTAKLQAAVEERCARVSADVVGC